MQTFEVDFIPCGEAGRHGDAITVRFTRPDNGVVVKLVVDAGFAPTGEAIVDHIDEWWDNRDVDAVILTHPDSDHIGGMETVVGQLNVRHLWVHRIGARGGSSLPAAKAVDDLIQLAEARGAVHREPFAPAEAFGGAIQILGPTEDWYAELVREQVEEVERTWSARGRSVVRAARRFLAALPLENRFDDAGGANPRNNSSLVFLLTVDEHRMLFTADAGVPALDRAWDQLLASGDTGTAPDFLQIPHHGSRRNVSSDLLDRILGPVDQPQTKYAYVNVAPEAVKHPSPRVANGFMRRGYLVSETRGGKRLYTRGGFPDRGWPALTPLEPLDETQEDN
jgi:beta-lactamase superfamily II metal-dependent hydrolase